MHIDLSTPVETIYNPGRKRFVRDYEKKGKPVVIKGLLEEQPAGEKWTREWFRQELEGIEIGLFDNRVEAHKWSHTTHPDVFMGFEEYFDIISGEEPTPLRMFVANVYKIKPSLKKDFGCPKFFNNPLGFVSLMFMGGSMTEVKGHFDIDRSGVLLTQIFGHKRVILLGPENTPLLYRVPFNLHSLADVREPDFKEFPALQHVKGYTVTLGPGDSLYMPPGYWHFITYLSGGMSVAHRKLNRNPIMLARALWSILFEIPVDKSLNRIFGHKWYRTKEKWTHRRVNKALSRMKLPEKSYSGEQH